MYTRGHYMGHYKAGKVRVCRLSNGCSSLRYLTRKYDQGNKKPRSYKKLIELEKMRKFNEAYFPKPKISMDEMQRLATKYATYGRMYGKSSIGILGKQAHTIITDGV